jgi:hypothetical protein
LLGYNPTEVTVTLFNIFEVPVSSDDEFIAWWRRTGEFIEQRIGPVSAALHRSSDPHARFRYVNVATIEDPRAWQAAVSAPGFPGRDQPGRRHPGLFELVRGRAEGDDEPGPRLIAPFEAGADEDALLADWNRAAGGRLYRALCPSSDFRFVELSPPARASAVGRLAPHAAIYDVVAT